MNHSNNISNNNFSKKVAGLTAALLLTLASVGTAYAQSTTTTTTPGTGSGGGTMSTTTTTTPGVPSAGAGGNATQNLILLGASGLAMLVGAAYLGRRLTR